MSCEAEMALPYLPVAEANVDTRATFIARTYAHLLGAVLAFIGIEIDLFRSGVVDRLAEGMLALPWLLSLGGFVFVS